MDTADARDLRQFSFGLRDPTEHQIGLAKIFPCLGIMGIEDQRAPIENQRTLGIAELAGDEAAIVEIAGGVLVSHGIKQGPRLLEALPVNQAFGIGHQVGII
ncbi:MAG: hypothetical protein O9309_14980 [Rhizobium sp.]|nr:hypothetical protein [Rhizobium sp.]